jgi:hypothetical protein
MLTSCRTYKVSDSTQVYDTLLLSKLDTVYISKEILRVDTFTQDTKETITLNAVGDTIKVAIYRDRWRDKRVIMHDTINTHIQDTIYISRASEAAEVKERQLSTWQKMKMSVGGFTLFFCLFLVGVIIVVITFNKRRE